MCNKIIKSNSKTKCKNSSNKRAYSTKQGANSGPIHMPMLSPTLTSANETGVCKLGTVQEAVSLC